MTAGQLIAAVTANQGDREAACRIGQSRQQIQARLIGPLQVVEEHRHGAAASRGGQHRAHRRGSAPCRPSRALRLALRTLRH